MQLIAIGIGGFCGAIGRYLLSYWLPFSTSFPTSTLLANLFGCFLLGLILQLHYWKINSFLTQLIATGFLGSFTTFSAFSIETIYFLELKQFLLAASYVGLSVGGGILLAFCGLGLGRWKQSQTFGKHRKRTEK